MKWYMQTWVQKPGPWLLRTAGRDAYAVEAIKQVTSLTVLVTLLAFQAPDKATAEPVHAAGAACLGATGSGDTDGDGDVDRDDLAWLPFCLVGPDADLAGGVCKCFLTDGDSDVDLIDMGTIMGMFSGPIGCTLNDKFYAPGEVGEFPENCGVCDPAASTTSLTPIGAGELCNKGTGDVCDPDEVCSGASTKCPGDSFKSSATVCNQGSGDFCDPDEFCPGVPDAKCPSDVFKSSDTVCNSGSGDFCDPDEVCPGVPDAKCPSDVFKSSNTVCNPGSGDFCDPDEVCPGVADAPCPGDIVAAAGTVCNTGSGDACDSNEVCSGVADASCPGDMFASAGTPCRPAAGPCDLPETCAGTPGVACPADVKQSASFVCRAAGTACDEAETCSGTSNDCPADTGRLCPNGEACGADTECISGSCNGGLCGEGAAVLGGSCNSDPDCVSGLVCDGGACLGAFDTFCLQEGQCATGLMCDAEDTGRCKRALGSACSANSDCAADAPCSNGACRLNLNEVCSTHEECGSGYCHCALYEVPICTPGVPCPPIRCVPSGLCKLRLGDDCTASSQCPSTFRFEDATSGEFFEIAQGSCVYQNATDRVCVPGLFKIQTVCETNPPGRRLLCDPATTGGLAGQPCSSAADCPNGLCRPHIPQIGDSPNDGLCGSGRCFRGAGGEYGPCTPASVCDPATTGGLAGTACTANADCPGGTCLNKCGGPLNPPDYKCCRGDNGVCSSDFDCCAPYADRMRGCKSNDRCGPLSIAGEPCSTTEDCLRRGDLACVNGFCEAPFVPPVLPRGAECDPANPNGYCETGSVCLNCNPEGRGYRCVDSAEPCCNSGTFDEFWCGSTLYNDAFIWTNSCCNYKCYGANDVNHCGECGTNCENPDNLCVVPGTERCEVQGEDFVCAGAQSEKACPDPPNTTYVSDCIPTGPGTFDCWNYEPVIDPNVYTDSCLEEPLDNVACSANDQCKNCDQNCECVAPSGHPFAVLFSGSRCECP